ncbi:MULTISPECIES: BglII/BstYI family type II restriction endonuclease [Sphingomonas]|uniref:Restriction endonuclease BglII n=1 Tax=Sphingomonas trueperi TaxID=53317 RepID=A0A7X6BDR6_9SPHN|nr:BglII/BstYI family type II restriction endonuclease [Sphingomonas sp. ABOLD]NJB98027.1 hypothetical protein [Sphingomonas trueperi]
MADDIDDFGGDSEADGDGEDAYADVDLAPSEVADSVEAVKACIPPDILAKYEVYSYRNAALILSQSRPVEFEDILSALRSFEITTTMIRTAGGNESEIPKLFSSHLRSKGWHETIVQADLLVRLLWREATGRAKRGKPVMEPKERLITRAKFLDGHKIDYVKDRVAFDLEWNSKDQTFDRDLYAFSAFSQCGVIDVGVLVTRSADLNRVFRSVGPALKKTGEIEMLKPTATKPAEPRPTYTKYGASTTWMGKLLYRLNAGRNGPCPVLAFGIKPECVTDWSDPDAD